MPVDCRRAPAIDAVPTGPTTAEVTVTPPAGGPWSSYDVTLCPVGGPASECVTTTCTTPAKCPVTDLNPDTSYVTTASGTGPMHQRRWCMPCVGVTDGLTSSCCAALLASDTSCGLFRPLAGLLASLQSAEFSLPSRT